jgi:SAM-dependent methyltransferase
VEVEQLEFLLSEAGQRLLAAATAALGSGDDLAAVERLRRSGADAGHVAAAMTQARLRAQAADKFGPDASRMYFTPDGLEQATHGVVAARRAKRVAAAGRRRVLDLCCGVGSDLVAFARAGLQATGVDRDPVAAGVAAANLAALGLDGAVVVADVVGFPTDGLDGHDGHDRPDTVFVDPARRDRAGRVFDPERYSPPWSHVDTLVRAGAIAKVAPGIPHELVPDDVEAEWVSVGGRLREATLWPASLAETRRRATVLGRDGGVAQLTGGADQTPAPSGPVGRFLYEPDDAVVRAHLVAEFAESLGGWLLDPHLAYVSADETRPTYLGSAYRVLESLPYREKALRAALRARDVGALQIKKRGVAVTPEELRARLRLRGSASATLVLTRTPRGAEALLVEPLDRPRDSPSAGRAG